MQMNEDMKNPMENGGLSGQEDGQDYKNETKPSAISELLSWIAVFAAAIVVALLLNTFIIANSKVPTGSMEDTIMQGDRVIGSRLSYVFGEPERGDVVIFKYGWICPHCKVAEGAGEAPDICPFCESEIKRPETLYYLKRTIGLPGDKIEIKQEGSVRQGDLDNSVPGLNESMGDDAELATAAVYVNGEKLEEDYLKEPMLYTGDMEFEVPEDCYFFLGDNRNNSLDARYWEDPYISEDKLVAKVLFRYFPDPSFID